MNLVQLLSLLAFSAALIWIMRLGGNAQLRRLPEGKAKQFLRRYYVVLSVTFLAGGITRGIQQDTKSAWLDGFVPVFVGLFFVLLGLPFLWGLEQNVSKGLRKALSLLLGLSLPLIGFATVWFGITRIMAAFR